MNLSGDYDPNDFGEFSAVMTFDGTDLRDTVLKFQSWLNTDAYPYAWAMLEVESDSGSQSWASLDGQEDDSWQQQEFDISELADGQSEVTVTWSYGVADQAYSYSGWNLDDVEIIAVDDGASVCTADYNDDGSVDVKDLLFVLDQYDDPYTIDDLLQVIGEWGMDCSN